MNSGDPPRDPNGPFRDVYRNLIHPLFPARRAWSGTEHLFWLGMMGGAAVVTLGVVPALYFWGVRKQKREYDALFRYGLFTPGLIRSVPAHDGGLYATIKYEFEVGGVVYLGYMRYAQEMTRYWSSSDTVSVLYDPEDPGRSCVVYC